MSVDQKRLPRKRLKNVLNVRTDDEFKMQLEALRRNEPIDPIPSRSTMVRLLVNRAYQDLDYRTRSRTPQPPAKARSKHDA